MRNEKLYFKVINELTEKQELAIKRRFNELFKFEGVSEVCDIVADLIFYKVEGWDYVTRSEILKFLKNPKKFIEIKEAEFIEEVIS